MRAILLAAVVVAGCQGSCSKPPVVTPPVTVVDAGPAPDACDAYAASHALGANSRVFVAACEPFLPGGIDAGIQSGLAAVKAAGTIQVTDADAPK